MNSNSYTQGNKQENLKSQSLRNNEYYQMQHTYDELYYKSSQKQNFNKLMPIITNRDNILLAYRNIKRNKGSLTAGCDNKTIKNIEKLGIDEYVKNIQHSLFNYSPMPIRRVEIPKPFSDKTRPLGIPTIKDRLIQQAIKQVLEPICEAKFHKHSYGFRPQRSTKDAIARFNSLVNINKLHLVIDIDIKGFFDNVNHAKLLKQIWSLGIHDKKLLKIISRMLKSEIIGQGISEKGVPQGGILSPLLSNIVLNELDWWISNQWETLKTRHSYSKQEHKYRAMKNSNLKECLIVRYADDFKVLCRNHNEAQRLFIAIQMWLKERLGLEISSEKSKITNLRKEYSEFLGFKFKAVKKGKENNKTEKPKYVAHSWVADKTLLSIVLNTRQKVRLVQKGVKAVEWLNSYILGIHNYYNAATHCNTSFTQIHARVRHTIHNGLKPKDIMDKSTIPKYMNELGYTKSKQLRSVLGKPLIPIGYIQHKTAMCFSQGSAYINSNREKFHTNQKAVSLELLLYTLENPIKSRSIEYNDNRISKLCACYGKCEISGVDLEVGNMECHHKTPIYLGGKDNYQNLIWVTKPIHKLIHATDIDTIEKYSNCVFLSKESFDKLNKLRKMAGNNPL
ncbi:group II intron reverse transcriptase/maturase [Helicobacter sp. MIT 00-7814]|uniref:group II intron reverse transcriptase/maturase n=1 Tax=unclassified Helicobacter TaxID=2593540 RepID=UPI000E1EC9C5|nr:MULTISPECIES: group II intron reverse transcriptase/maturase [unclassified Helicobacter]RDU52706.1 group II intron reverse transcriptase/maturase [Helicobacter sp. MIT 99-10781]RDU53140.1 group II intron reverse transcriptase/maturase [Helicobacter sp. MIT 00-7814]